MEHAQIYPSPGCVEHCPMTLWKNTLICLAYAIHKATAKIGSNFKIRSIGVTNQRETTIGLHLFMHVQYVCICDAFICVLCVYLWIFMSVQYVSMYVCMYVLLMCILPYTFDSLNTHELAALYSIMRYVNL